MNRFDWNDRLDKMIAADSFLSFISKHKGTDFARDVAESVNQKKFDARFSSGVTPRFLSPDKAPAGYKVPIDELRPRLELSRDVNRVINSASGFQDITKGVLAGSPAYLKYKQDQELIQAEQERTQSFFGKLFRYDAIAKSAEDSAGVFYRGEAKQRLADETSATKKAYLFRQRLNKLFGFDSPSKSAKDSASVFKQALDNDGGGASKKKQETIAKGVQRAFGGRRLTVLRDLFGFNFGYGHIIRAMTSFAVNQSHYQQSMHLAAINAGTSADRLQMLGLGSKIFGGNESDAASVYASINDFLHGSRYGYGFGKLENLYRFGVRIHPGMSANEVLKSIADRYSQLPMEDRAVMARSVGMPPAIQDMMSKGGDSLMAELEHMKEYVPSNIEALRENSKAVRELGVAAQTLGRELIPIFTPVAKSLTEGVNFASDIVRFLKGEDTGNYNVVRDFFQNLLNPTRDENGVEVSAFSRTRGAIKALGSGLGTSLLGMPMMSPYMTENHIIVDVNADPEFRDRLFKAISNNVLDYYTNKWLVPLELTNNIEVW